MNIQETTHAIQTACRQIGFEQIGTDAVGQLLATLCAAKPHGRFLELGTGCGFSTAWMLSGMDPYSTLISVENDAKVIAIAQEYLASDTRLTLIHDVGEQVIAEQPEHAFDLIFADTWPGKYHHLDETLALLKTGGIYIIDDMLPQSNWPEGHQAKAEALIETLSARDDLRVTVLEWDTGIIICTKTDNDHTQTNTWNPTRYQQHAHFVSDLAMPVVDLLDPQPQEHILDLGCGEGTLGLEIARRGAKVLGIDLSPEMVTKAQANGLEARVMSVTDMPFVETFDAVFSNAMLHWVHESDLAVDNIARALKPGGRFIAEFGGAGNVRYIVEAMRREFADHPEYGAWEDPWYFPTPREYSAILEAHGLSVKSIELIPRPTPIDDIAHWLEIFTGGVTTHLSPEQTQAFRTRVRERLKDTIYTEEEGWIADYVRLRVRAVKQ